MTDKAAFSAEEWETLSEAPLAASMFVTMASPSLFGAMGEVFAATRRLVEGAQNPSGSPLLMALLGEFKQLDTARAAQPDFESRDIESVKATLRATLSGAGSLLKQKATPAEAAEIRAWLNGIATATAEAAKEGGFLGFGGVRVSEDETAALNEINSLLGA